MTRAGVVPWPEEFVRQYVAKGYWRQRPLGALMWEWADAYGPRVALVDGDRRVTYRELAETADNLAEGMAGTGLKRGDNILVQLPNCWEFIALVLACARLGVAPVLALPPHREHELTYMAELAEVSAVVAPGSWRGFDHQSLAEHVARTRGHGCRVLIVGDTVRPGNVDLRALMTAATGDPAARRHRLDTLAPDASEVLLFLLSGGTTGLPKIIARTHNDYEYNARRSGEVCGYGRDTVYLAVLPVAHNFALASPGVLAALMSGGRAVLMPSPNPEAAFAAVERERATVTSLVPAVARRWLEAAAKDHHDLSSLRVVQVGGSVLSSAEAQSLLGGLGGRLQQVFGMAEGLLNYTRLDDPDHLVLTTQGRPICPDDEILLVDEDDVPVPPGRPGRLLTRGPYTPRGYFAAPEHNARAFTADGWYRTGDVVHRDAAGNVTVEGRTKDLINRGGEKISADEVEDLVRSLPQVADVAVVPAPHRELGESVCACVVLKGGQTLDLADIQRLFHERGVAAFKTPELLMFLPALPQTPVGKIDKKALRKLAEPAVPTRPTPGRARPARVTALPRP
ncbi:AMP-binding protein [Streptomyces spinoverrucosus]|uniref:(2,3-dihydroxybenzoyl)adenylate synthase n=1 Tax=Streptomyces spinoverrucosus TaxID=284043 RepID=UPI0018C44BF3|nr:AMP-binding protein [Streptomyces spinoverrucosus]MBG0853554.1 AMP-binding protein [Streptomyces spinoverrucosus]